MESIITENKANLLYTKAESSFIKCINNSENMFLEDELQFNFENIRIKRMSIDIQNKLNNDIEFNFVIILSICNNSNLQVGTYTYIENNFNQVIDDYLVFF